MVKNGGNEFSTKGGVVFSKRKLFNSPIVMWPLYTTSWRALLKNITRITFASYGSGSGEPVPHPLLRQPRDPTRYLLLRGIGEYSGVNIFILNLVFWNFDTIERLKQNSRYFLCNLNTLIYFVQFQCYSFFSQNVVL